MSTLNRSLVDTMVASAVVAEVTRIELPVSGVTVLFRAMPHLDVVGTTAGAMMRVDPLAAANRKQRRAAGDRGPAAPAAAPDLDGAYLDLLCKTVARSVVDDAGDLIFTGPEDVAAWLNSLHELDFAEVIREASATLNRSRLDQPADDDDAPAEDLLDVGKGR
jgi:hypothetical protein